VRSVTLSFTDGRLCVDVTAELPDPPPGSRSPTPVSEDPQQHRHRTGERSWTPQWEHTMSEQLEHVYRDYTAALNGRHFDRLDRFVHDRLTYNGEDWTREKYQALLADDVRKIPDLHYEIRLLVVHADQVACRLWFDCTPQQEFLGTDAAGHRVSFAEHVCAPSGFCGWLWGRRYVVNGGDGYRRNRTTAPLQMVISTSHVTNV
jgi:predicted ester cyclase